MAAFVVLNPALPMLLLLLLLLLCSGIHAATAAFCVPLFQVGVTFAFVSAETIHPVHLVRSAVKAKEEEEDRKRPACPRPHTGLLPSTTVLYL